MAKLSKKGSLIVFEGIDGSGKTTQYKLFIEHLKKNKIKYQTIDFPQYEISFFGKFVRRFLKGEFGPLNKVHPYLASVLYAMDRYQAKKKLDQWLKDGFVVVANRYAGSNMAHQGAKVATKDRQELFKFLTELEFKVNKIPKPTVNIFLDVDPKTTLQLINKMGKEKDIAEADLKHQRLSYRVYRELSRGRNWLRINCSDEKGNIKSPIQIHENTIELLKQKAII